MLSDLRFPTTLTRNLLYALRAFESNVKKSMEDFSLPRSLMFPNSSEFTGFLTDGSHLFFARVLAGQPKNIFGSVDINEENRRK